MRAMRAARAESHSMAMARLAGSASIHSMPMEPEPAPISHNSSPLRGASAASVTARMSRLVICPSCSNQSSGRPGVSAMTRAPGEAISSMASVFNGPMSAREKSAARAERISSRGPPRFSSTCRRESPKPNCERCAATRPGVVPSQERISNRRPGCKCGVMRSKARPCSDSSAQSCWLQHRRDAASAKADGQGRQTISSRATCRAKTSPTP